jgi:TolB-like protein/Tfp pilus assembly protein PilF
MDFGLAKIADTQAVKLTNTGTTVGTVAYMSPEQTRGEETDTRSDIWSLGVVLYEMLTGKLPFAAEYDHAIMYDILNEDPVSIDTYRQDLPEAFQNIIDRALVKDPAKRYQDIGYLLLDLKQIKKGSSQIETQALNAVSSKKSKLIIPFSVLFLIIVITAAWWFFKTVTSERAEKGEQWENSIAVLPFKNISPDQEQEYFCDGMTEQIITSLSQLKQLKVIARTSVMRYKDSDATIPEIAADLGVAHILEGSIRKAGERIRVTAQLIQAEGGHHLWARDYNRELKDIFDVQDDVSQAIAGALLTQFSSQDAEDLKTKGTQNTEAYEYYLKGRHVLWKTYFLTDKEEDFKKAENLLKRAIELDSSYAPAYAELADLYNYYYWNLTNELDKKKYLDLQTALIDKAYALDPNSADVHRVKGWVYVINNEFDAAYKSLKQALVINPNNTRCLVDMGFFLSSKGLYILEKDFFTKAIEMDPLDANLFWRRAILFRELGDLEASLKDYQKALDLDPNHIRALNGITKYYFLTGDFEQAERHLSRSEAMEADVIDTKYTRMYFYAASGDKEKTFALLEELGGEDWVNTRLDLHCLLGEKEEALAILKEIPRNSYLTLLYHPYLELIRDTPEFKMKLPKAKVEYEENLAKYGDIRL